uniref:Uncharacterized protein n=1 Tax=Anopheles coluzzii TaxID=1518534 RepID=A0A6E8WAJ3_ANOCL|nr:zinc finger protein 101-like [Anopheles coluzzii]
MEAIVPNLNEICRLCLCEDIRFLIPASKLLDDSLSLKHIERFTGIRIPPNDCELYALCMECGNKLTTSVAFLVCCKNNDTVFRNLFDLPALDAAGEDRILVDFSTEVKQSPEIEVLEEAYTEPEVQETQEVQELPHNTTTTACTKPPDATEDHRVSSNFSSRFKKSPGIVVLQEPCTELEAKETRTVQSLSHNTTSTCTEPPSAAGEFTIDPNDFIIESLDSMIDDVIVHHDGGAESLDGIEHAVVEDEPLDDAGVYCDETSSSDQHDERSAKQELSASLSSASQIERKPPLNIPTDTALECSACEIKFVDEITFKRHYRRYHVSELQKSREHRKKRQLCVECGKMVLQLSAHRLTHTQEKQFSCPHCPMKMKSKGNICRHIEAVHLKKPAKTCETCGREFVHANMYKYHMLSVHGIGKAYECAICLKKFNALSSLKSHKQTAHEKRSAFECETCGKKFKRRHTLQMHIKQGHSNDKLYSCSLCPKRLKTLLGKQAHELAHSGAVFACTLCDKVFRYKCLLQGHVSQDHVKAEGREKLQKELTN